ncbi:YcjX family protein [Plastoroseomonas arctica]|uniref:YcjX family protein n=1 Tax=Plastoroseomonas arctica TaxID=1509237 RepID=A0AAF1JXK1_9PROT|nr:YcjX family protein [Plastoroseomonas arctica]MBR0656272.1 YcjX family protein [Plastoroseomonas arctica]
MDIFGRLGAGLRDAASAAVDAAHQISNVETLRVAVTGLSRAGKTVFMVSLISNLLALGRGRDTLPALRTALDDGAGRSRLISVAIEPSGVQRIPRFAYEENLAGLAGAAPHWPAFTDQPALITLRIRLRQRQGIAGMVGSLLGEREVRLELLDYPGEWLLDLPMLPQSFAQWSQQTLHLLGQPSRAGFADEFLRFLAAIPPTAAADEAVAQHGFRLYREALRRAKEEQGLRWLQPGRFLMPGPWGEAPFMHFFPFEGGDVPAAGSLALLLRERFETYKAEMRQNFFEPHFSRFNRQVILVDVLGALFAGRTAFEDSAMAIHAIAESYKREMQGALPFSRRIERIVFAATKADHVPDQAQVALRQTLMHMALPAETAVARGARHSFHNVASIICTESGDFLVDGIPERIVFGVPLGGTERKAFRLGSIPTGPVHESYWSRPYFMLPALRPPLIEPGEAAPIPQAGIDVVLAELIGDVL